MHCRKKKKNNKTPSVRISLLYSGFVEVICALASSQAVTEVTGQIFPNLSMDLKVFLYQQALDCQCWQPEWNCFMFFPLYPLEKSILKSLCYQDKSRSGNKLRQEPDPILSETTGYLTVLLSCRLEMCQERKRHRNQCLAWVVWGFLVVLVPHVAVQQK